MADEPVFPPPERRGAYRERQERPITAADVNVPGPMIVRRPENEPTRAIVEKREEAPPEPWRFPARNGYLDRNPWVFAAIIMALGAILTFSTAYGILHGASFHVRTALGGPLLLSLGLFALLASRRGVHARRPGLYAAVAGVGFIAAIALLALLGH